MGGICYGVDLGCQFFLEDVATGLKKKKKDGESRVFNAI